jgi:hypothetical protein
MQAQLGLVQNFRAGSSGRAAHAQLCVKDTFWPPPLLFLFYSVATTAKQEYSASRSNLRHCAAYFRGRSLRRPPIAPPLPFPASLGPPSPGDLAPAADRPVARRKISNPRGKSRVLADRGCGARFRALERIRAPYCESVAWARAWPW